MESVYAVANEFIRLSKSNGKNLTILQLLKLTYIAHGLSLAILNKKGFNEAVEAWKLGPVVSNLYFHFKSFGSKPIDKCAKVFKNFQHVEPKIEDENLKKIIALTWNLYKDVPGNKLVSITHEVNTPWSLTYVPNENKIIDDELTKKYYLKFVDNLEHEFLNLQSEPAR